jgi:hypothetical protein
MYYSGKIFTYKLDRTTITVGAPSMLAMSTSPASAGASSSASVAAGSSAVGAAAGSVLLSATGACGSTSATTGAGLQLLSAGSPTVSQSPSSPCSTGSEGGISCKHSKFCCQHTQHCNTSTQLLYLLRRSLSDLQLLSDALVCHVARPSRRRRQTSLQTSRRIVDKGDIRQSRPAKPRPQLEPLLKRLLIFLV